MKYARLFIFFFLLAVLQHGFSREGMWLPVLVEQTDYSDLQAAGFKFSSDDIYNINKACLKDAIVLFGQGCTGGIISNNGLLITNHHCGAGTIARHSSPGQNYLVDGFWAMNQSQEISNPGLTVKILNRMLDFTDTVINSIPKNLSYSEQQDFIKNRTNELVKSIEDTSNYKASIESFYAGNQYYLFLYTEYSDIRLVGAPPESIASFGGDTDNWVWPRHSADFSIFRIYTSPDGSSVGYNTENIPLQPKRYLTLSVRGINEGDPTLILGYPAQTFRYLYSAELEYTINTVYPLRIGLRNGRLEIINKARKADEKIYLQYAQEQSGIGNAWKKWKGVLFGFKHFDVLEKQKEYEENLVVDAGSKKDELMEMYDMFEDSYSAFKPYKLAMEYFSEAAFVVKPFLHYFNIYSLIYSAQDKNTDLTEIGKKLTAAGRNYFKNYDYKTDKALTIFLLDNFRINIDEMYLPETLKEFKSSDEFNLWIDKVYSKSVLTDSVRYIEAVKKFAKGKTSVFADDPLVKLCYEFSAIYYNALLADYEYYSDQYESLYREYIPLLKSIDTTRKFYPDANHSLRYSYGTIYGYSPSDAVDYGFQTFIDGLFQKNTTGLEEYRIPDQYQELCKSGDFTPYSDSLGRLPLCFIASNHTSGGNSGSPVLNANGQMVGLNFDRTWESTMSDFYFDNSICRNISVDIRYILFIIDKYAGAGYLLKEMDIDN